MSRFPTFLFVAGILSCGGVVNAAVTDPPQQKMVNQTTIFVCDKTEDPTQVCTEPQARLIIVCTEVPEDGMGYAACPKEWERHNNEYPIQAYVQNPEGGFKGAKVEVVHSLVPAKAFTPHLLIKLVR
ncbi:MAG: hypothetical protein MN733_33365 [Nitrososphaera sp.]|nr:hypothetical protein [Nitrososphaera sp.]